MGRAVHLIIGTKAQFIKMAPIAFVMEREGVPYRIIDLSQHGALTGLILRDFGLRPDVRFLHPTGANVASYAEAALWLSKCLRELARSRSALRRTLLLDDATPLALVHGDTLSTLLGTYLARRLGIEVGLVEAGLSSGRLFSPFPEEAVRRHVERRVDYLFAAGPADRDRLSRRKVRGAVFDIGYNTGRDAFELIASKVDEQRLRRGERYSLLTLHRAETITRPGRLVPLIRHVLALAEHLPPIRFFLHEPTERALARAGLRALLRAHPHIEAAPLAAYPEFVEALVGADFVLTDGGSIQEEASYAGKPCLVLRQETERMHGLGTTAALTTFDVERDLAFLRSRAGLSRLSPPASPSCTASRRVLALVGALGSADAEEPLAAATETSPRQSTPGPHRDSPGHPV